MKAREITAWDAVVIIIVALVFLAVFCFVAYKAQSGHKWHEMYRDEYIRVERCSKCGEERFYNVY